MINLQNKNRKNRDKVIIRSLIIPFKSYLTMFLLGIILKTDLVGLLS